MAATAHPSALGQGPGEGGSRLELALARGVDLAVLDLDHTLVFSKTAHRTLIINVLVELGAADRGALESVYDQSRGLAYDVIMRRMFDGAGGEAVLRHTYERFTQTLYDGAPAFISSHARELGVRPLEGAIEILERLQSAGIPFKIATGSPRAIALALIAATGLDRYISPESMTCCGDLQWNKESPLYWNTVLGDVARTRVIGFEDHPHGAENMLVHAGIAEVFVVPSVDRNRFDALMIAHSDRLIVLQNWNELS